MGTITLGICILAVSTIVAIMNFLIAFMSDRMPIITLHFACMIGSVIGIGMIGMPLLFGLAKFLGL